MHEAGRARTSAGALGGLQSGSYLRSSQAFVGVRLVSLGWRALQLMHRVVMRHARHPLNQPGTENVLFGCGGQAEFGVRSTPPGG